MRETTGSEVYVHEERDLQPPTTTITTCVVSPVYADLDGDEESFWQARDTTDSDLADSDDFWDYDVSDDSEANDYTDSDYISSTGSYTSSNNRCHCSVEEGKSVCKCDASSSSEFRQDYNVHDTY
ncbi:hypothetical protein FPOAC2_07772 [Fusarium poae]|jgi:hypothetical protein|uniref:Uncharacterized protein n=1 Tax=Fusarium poae TaxID=36050 RepID=A0A1B8AJG9_FUSPO|nr:hypothetical protein FPOAC1_007866 [Fusarium poae]KAG8668485.1 hypothetical protein FPOAC1_007866 [Fusarium poae]OBS20729.1 hypothetical protein FPOA_07069 [Fusarium poae]